jgi:hypothetical protein
MTRSAVIFALDGVLANDARRRPAEGQKLLWRQRHDPNLIEEDPSFPNVVQLCKQLGTANDIIIISERPILVSEVTRKWIRRHGIRYGAIYMKQDVKDRPPADSKTELIRQVVDDKWKPWLLVDCDREVLRRVKGLAGIQCLLV